MNGRSFITTLLAVLALCAPAADAATRIDLNRDWAFRTEADTQTVAHWPESIPWGTRDVDLPHSWNRAGKDYDYLGTGWYFRRFDLPQLPADAIAQLNFGATFYKARVWLNGVEIGTHEGGYTAYSFDITSQLRDSNLLVVAVDNRPGMLTIPGFGARGAPDAWYDWWAYGGIVRDVWIDLHGPVRVALQQIRSKLDGSRATVSDQVTLVSRGRRSGTLGARITAPDGAALPLQTTALTLEDGSNEAALKIALSDIQRWDLGHPNLYRIDLEWTEEGGKPVALASDTFGLRDIRVGDRHLFINGERVRLTGMTRHADSPWEGLAETPGTWRHDWEDMKSLNMTLTRPVHYAPDPGVVRFADEHGILLIPEIPVWQASEAQLADPQYLEVAKRQMRELIAQYGNHPSVFAWSVLNESAAGTPGGIRFFRAMRDEIRRLDPGRYVTLADDNLSKLKRAEDSAAHDADFLMMNQYFGSWHGPRDALEAALDKVDRLFPEKMVIISEFGFPGTFAKNAAEADATRTAILREQLPLLAKRDWIGGAILWCYQDYKSRRYFWPGQEQGYLEHGIVDRDRQRKPSYFAWAELNAPAHIDARWKRDGDNASSAFAFIVAPRGVSELPSYSLHGYKVQWQLLGAESREVASDTVLLNNETTLSIEHALPAHDAKVPLRLAITILRPDGSVAMRREIDAPAP